MVVVVIPMVIHYDSSEIDWENVKSYSEEDGSYSLSHGKSFAKKSWIWPLITMTEKIIHCLML